MMEFNLIFLIVILNEFVSVCIHFKVYMDTWLTGSFVNCALCKVKEGDEKILFLTFYFIFYIFKLVLFKIWLEI